MPPCPALSGKRRGSQKEHRDEQGGKLKNRAGRKEKKAGRRPKRNQEKGPGSEEPGLTAPPVRP
jgi:hypothetical protein